MCAAVVLSDTHTQRRRPHRIIGGHIKEDLGSGGRKSPSGVQGRSPPEAEAFFVKLHIMFALKYNKQQLLLLHRDRCPAHTYVTSSYSCIHQFSCGFFFNIYYPKRLSRKSSYEVTKVCRIWCKTLTQSVNQFAVRYFVSAYYFTARWRRSVCKQVCLISVPLSNRMIAGIKSARPIYSQVWNSNRYTSQSVNYRFV